MGFQSIPEFIHKGLFNHQVSNVVDFCDLLRITKRILQIFGLGEFFQVYDVVLGDLLGIWPPEIPYQFHTLHAIDLPPKRLFRQNP